MSDDILNSLKAQYEAHRAIAKSATEAMKDVQAAIAAIEARRASLSINSPAQPARSTSNEPTRRRGALMAAALECIRDGHANVRQIKSVLESRGQFYSKQSISNAIARLQAKGSVVGASGDRWEIANRTDLRTKLEASLKAEDAKVAPLTSPEANGAAGVHLPATALHTAST